MLNLIKQEKKILALKKTLKEANSELEKLRAQNDSMREGMRRCVTCDYRLEVKARKHSIPDLSQASDQLINQAPGSDT